MNNWKEAGEFYVGLFCRLRSYVTVQGVKVENKYYT